jgi:hypothetical protein
MADRPLRVMIYDRSCRGFGPLPGLTHSWAAGAWLYRLLGRLDRWRGVDSWAEALGWLAGLDAPIAEVQLWSHGQWGNARIAGEVLDRPALQPGHRHHGALGAVAERMLPGGESLWWFRTCQTFGARAGHDFARAWTDRLGCRGAGHSFIIGPWQSGLHSLSPGAVPAWSVEEGIAAGSPDAPAKALWSKPWSPNTITCFHGRIPAGF